MSDPLDKMFEELADPHKPVDFPGKRPLRDLSKIDKRPKLVAMDEEWDAKPIIKRLHGVETQFYAVGHLARALGRQTVTVRSWEAKGWLPNSTYRAPTPKGEQVPGKKTKGRRLYTRAQVEIVVEAARGCGVLIDNGRNANWKAFTRAVVDGWRTLS